MQIKKMAFGEYQTNCYIVSIDGKDLIIDPGMGATKWVLENVTNPKAILNTHGHFDHIWSNAELQKKLHIPIIIQKEDAFMLQNDPFGFDIPKSQADRVVEADESIIVDGIELKFLHFPGHTPGCSVIEIKEHWFSGDFIFKGSIGRVDFPYSDPKKMKESLLKLQKIDYDKIVHPGHGLDTTIKDEQRFIDYWLKAI